MFACAKTANTRCSAGVTLNESSPPSRKTNAPTRTWPNSNVASACSSQDSKNYSWLCRIPKDHLHRSSHYPRLREHRRRSRDLVDESELFDVSANRHLGLGAAILETYRESIWSTSGLAHQYSRSAAVQCRMCSFPQLRSDGCVPCFHFVLHSQVQAERS